MIGIYKITSPSEKIYIGQSINIEKRFKDYINKNCKFQKRLIHSLNKYGVENHKFEILTLCYREQLNIFERDFQEAYDAIGKNGLNCFLTKTDTLPRKYSNETLLKFSKAKTGVVFSEETRKKISLALKGRKMSEEEKIMRKPYDIAKSKPIICTVSGNIWYSLRECAKEHNISKSILSNYLNEKNPNKTTLIYY